MKFFNKKEQVIDLQLTQYGKHLLSKGVFKPVYYAFFDDNILYNGHYGDVTGSQNDIQARILTDTPQIETQYVFRGIESEVKRAIKHVRSSEEYLEMLHNPELMPPPMPQPIGDKLYGLQYPIGTSELNSEYVPAWKIKFLKGRISSSATRLTGAYSPIHVPQLTAYDIKYKTFVRELPEGEVPKTDATLFDNTYMDIITDEGSILLEVQELNTFFGHDNFEMEVYEIQEEKDITALDSDTTTREVYIPLYFTKSPNEMEQGDILLDPEESDSEILADLKLNPSYAEYFLDINVDNEIDLDTLCEYVVEEQTQGIFSSKVLDCREEQKRKTIEARDIFNTDVTSEDLGGCDDDAID